MIAIRYAKEKYHSYGFAPKYQNTDVLTYEQSDAA